MPSGINLIPELTEKEIKSGVYRRKTNVVAILSLTIIGVVVLGLIAYRGFLFVQAQDIKSRTDKAEKSILENRDIEISLLSLDEKLARIDSILKTGLPASSVLSSVSSASNTTIPILIKDLELSESGEITVSGIAVNSDIFAEWIDKLLIGNGKEFFARVNLVSLVRNDTGYVFSLRMDFLKKGVLENE